MNIKDLYDIFIAHPKVCTDTRNISEGCIFFGLKGEHFDGNAFANEAIDKGAAYAVIDNPTNYRDSQNFILVENSLVALQNLAKIHRQNLNIPFIGITGTNGKTTTKELFNVVLSKKYKTFATKGNLNNHLGVPLSILSIGSSIEIAVIEMGANHIGEIDFLCQIAMPTYGIITNIGKAHLEGFGSFNGVIATKTELYRYLDLHNGCIFFNADDPLLSEQVQKVHCRKISYGTISKADFRGKLEQKNDNPFMAFWFWDKENKEHYIKSSLFGDYNFENALAAVCAGLVFDVSPISIVNAISEYIPTNNRSQLVKHKDNIIICDFYNANPSSMEKALHHLANIVVGNTFKKVAILGEMKELGQNSSDEHKKILELAINIGINEIFAVGRNYPELSGLPQIKYFENNSELISYLSQNKITESYVLIKGSRASKLEEIYQSLFIEDK
jgi:UDP-N-acetylmuramoyl-tripeptide--D-alanyl-D-alanine ligase